MELYRTTKHENTWRVVLFMRKYRLNRSEKQDQRASSRKERIAEYVPTYAFTPHLFLNIDIF